MDLQFSEANISTGQSAAALTPGIWGGGGGNSTKTKNSNASSNGGGEIIKNSDIAELQQTLHLKDVLLHEKGLDLFIQHLAKEFSLECVLSLIEFIQFECYVFDKIMQEFDEQQTEKNKDENNSGINNRKRHERKWKEHKLASLLVSKKIKLPQSVPPSHIVSGVYTPSGPDGDIGGILMGWRQSTMYDNSNSKVFMRECKHKAHQLYEKYVKVGSALEINVSYRARKHLSDLMNDYETWMSMDEKTISQTDLMTYI